MNRATVLMPTLDIAKAQQCCDLLISTAGIPTHEYRILTGMEGPDEKQVGVPAMVKRLMGQADSDYLVYLGDDVVPSHNWLKMALESVNRFAGGIGIVGFNDGFIDGNAVATHWIAHRDMIGLLGGELFSTTYFHCYCDNELTDRAKEIGLYHWDQGIQMYHDNPVHTKKGQLTAKQQEAYLSGHYDDDRRTYWRRKVERLGKFAICEPTTSGSIHTAFHRTFHAMDKPDHLYLLPSVPPGAYASSIASVRNDLVRQALSEGCSYVAMVDTDQTYRNPMTIYNLLAKAKEQDAIVGALVFSRYPPFWPVMRRWDGDNHYQISDEEWEGQGLVEVDATGTGCLVIPAKVLIEMDEPWFEDQTVVGGKMGEDIYFCRKARELGHKVFVDTDTHVNHLTTLEVDLNTYKLYKRLMGGREVPDGF